jgi:hypothetical protein
MYQLYIKEEFLESKDYYKGKSDMLYKDKVRFDKMMKKSSILKLDDFVKKNIDNLIKIHMTYERIDLFTLSDKDFIVYLDKFLVIVYKSLKSKILYINDMDTQLEYDDFIKVMSIETLKKLSIDYINFRKTIVDILGKEAKRIKSDKGLPIINVDYSTLEESNAEEAENDR